LRFLYLVDSCFRDYSRCYLCTLFICYETININTCTDYTAYYLYSLLFIQLTIYEGTYKIFRTGGAAIYTAVVVARRTTMSSGPVCQVAYSSVDVGSSGTRLFEVVYFAIASVREFLDPSSYTAYCIYSLYPV
jgi:hypothetical protein